MFPKIKLLARKARCPLSAFLLLNGCALTADNEGFSDPTSQSELTSVSQTTQRLVTDNGVAIGNGALLPNGATLPNGVSLTNGIQQLNGIPLTNGVTLLNSVTLPNGVPLTNSVTLPNGATLANGVTFLNGVTFANGVTFPNGAIINKGATLTGGGTFPNGAILGNGTILPNGSTLSNQTVLGAGAILGNGATLGNGVTFTNGTVLPNGTAFTNGSILPNGAVYGNGAVFTNGVTFPNGVTLTNGGILPNGATLNNGVTFLNGAILTGLEPSYTQTTSAILTTGATLPSGGYLSAGALRADGTTLYSFGTSVPSGTVLPAGSTLGRGAILGKNSALGGGVIFPNGLNLPSGTVLPPGTQLPSGTFLPSGTILPNGTLLGNGTILPNGTVATPCPGGVCNNGINIAEGSIAPPVGSPMYVYLQDPAKFKVLKYVLQCAMTPSQSVTVSPAGTAASAVVTGAVGLAAAYRASGALTQSDQEWVSACLLARVNQRGDSVLVDMVGDRPDLGMNSVSAAYPQFEATVFGNIFKNPPQIYAYRGDTNFYGASFPPRFCNLGTADCSPFVSQSVYCEGISGFPVSGYPYTARCAYPSNTVNSKWEKTIIHTYLPANHCIATTCELLGVTCGAAPDGCGQVLNCGTCNGTCAQTDAQFCASKQHACGRPQGVDACGRWRVPATCGTCATTLGTACIQSKQNSSATCANSTVTWSMVESESNNTPATSDTLESSTMGVPLMIGAFRGKLSTGSDVDWVHLPVPPKQTLVVSVRPPSGKNYDVKIYDSAGTVLLANGNAQGAGVTETATYSNASSSVVVYKIKIMPNASTQYSSSEYLLEYARTIYNP